MEQVMTVLRMIIELFGSLGLFLYGMKLMSEGLHRSAGEGLQKVLNTMSSNRFIAVMSGFLVTSVIQSSSATTVMIVGFVNAGLLNLQQAIGLIMGANIGTTITGWIVAILGFKVDIQVLALIAVGFGMVLVFSRKYGKSPVADVFIGFGILFLGIVMLKNAVPDVGKYQELLPAIQNLQGYGFGSYLMFVAFGTLLTIVVQSSSAAMAVTMTLTVNGWIGWEASAAIILGENIGTTVTAYIASLKASDTARRAARAHTLFNVFGVLWMSAIFTQFTGLVDWIIPGNVHDVAEIAPHLAAFHSLFNITNTFICIWFVPQFARLVEMLVKTTGAVPSGKYVFPHIHSKMQDTPEIDIANARKELSSMSAMVNEQFSSAAFLPFRNEDEIPAEVERLRALRGRIVEMHEQIGQFMVGSYRENASEKEINTISGLIRINGELDNISFASNQLVTLAERNVGKRHNYGKDALERIKPYAEMVLNFLDFNTSRVVEGLSAEDLAKAKTMENGIDERMRKLKKEAQKRLKQGAAVRTEMTFIDIIRHMEHVGDYSLRIAESLDSITRGVARS